MILRRTRILSGIQFTRHFIGFVVVEKQRLVGSNANVILTRETCGQCSSSIAGGKRRALASYFFIRISYMFRMRKCKGKSDLGLCSTLVLATIMPLRIADFRLKICLAAKFVGICHCTVSFCLQVLMSCTNLHPILPYILILETCGRFALENKMLALGVCLLQPCSSDCLPTNRFVSTTTNSMKCLLNWIPLRIRVRSRNIQFNLKVTLGRPKVHLFASLACMSLVVCVLLCFIKPILGNRYVRCRGFIVSEPRETHPRSEIADVPTLPCPPLNNLGCPDPHPSP